MKVLLALYAITLLAMPTYCADSHDEQSTSLVEPDVYNLLNDDVINKNPETHSEFDEQKSSHSHEDLNTSKSEHNALAHALSQGLNEGTGVGRKYHFTDELDAESEEDEVGDQYLDQLLKEFDKLDCEKYKNKPHKPKDLDYLNKNKVWEDFCGHDLRNQILEPIGQIDFSPLALYKHISKEIYAPLGYKYYEKFSFPDVLGDLIFLNDQFSMIHPETPVPDNTDFKNQVLQTFATIADYSSDFHHNKSLISSQILDLLKQFHIWWNVHRQRHQMHYLHKHTHDIIKDIMMRYRQTHDAMKATTIHILKNIKDGYFRFMKAYKMFNVVKDDPADMIAAEILRRYKNNVENIHLHKSSYDLRVTETAYMLDLLRAFYIVNYKMGVTDDESQMKYNSGIFNRIESVYGEYKKYLVETGSDVYNDFKDFTATILLKMKHRTYIIFKLTTIAGYMNLPTFNLESSSANAIKVYYEFLDHMLLIPNECLDLISNHLENCVNEKTSKLLVLFYNKYQLFASVGGADLLAYLRSNTQHIFQNIKGKDSYDNFGNFKNNFFAELFKFAMRYRNKYLIKDMGTVDDLENELGFQIEKSKQIHAVSKINYSLIDKLDRRLYNLFLNIKTKFNKYAPVEKDIKVMTIISKTVEHMMDKFDQSNSSRIDSNIISLTESCKKIVDAWLKKHSIHYIVNTSPMHAETPFTQYMPLPEAHSNVVQQVVSEPTIQSARVAPVGSGLSGQMYLKE